MTARAARDESPAHARTYANVQTPLPPIVGALPVYRA